MIQLGEGARTAILAPFLTILQSSSRREMQRTMLPSKTSATKRARTRGVKMRVSASQAGQHRTRCRWDHCNARLPVSLVIETKGTPRAHS